MIALETQKTSQKGFYQSIFFSVLEKMPLGALRIEFLNGEDAWFGNGRRDDPAVIRVRNPDFFKKSVLYGDIGFGESYMDGDWDTDDIASVVSWFILNIEQAPALSGSRSRNHLINALGFLNRWTHWTRANTDRGSRKNIRAHYDLSNDFFRTFLDPGMTYSCAYFETQDQPLESAQTAKYDRLCKKLSLRPRDRVLEIGGGWGGFSMHAARTYGCRVTSITISEEQYLYARERIRQEGLSEQVEVQLLDYRKLQGQFDKIVSIEMLEAVGDKYLETYFGKCHELLKRDGLLGLQYITCPDSRYDSLKKGVDWIQKHIFPGSLLLSPARITEAIRNTGNLSLHAFEDMGGFYPLTLEHWENAFEGNLDKVRALGFDEVFQRKWRYYLGYCKAGFRMRNISVAQAVYTRPNNLAISAS